MTYTLLVFAVVASAIVAAARRDTRRPWRPYASLCALLLSLAASVALSGCPLPPQDGCQPMATRCSPAGVPQRCSQTQRWSSGSLASCGGSATCCLARSPWGRSVHACVPQTQCIPEPTLADALVEAAVDAALEGGAQ